MKTFVLLMVLSVSACVLPRGAADLARMKATPTPKEWSVGEIWRFDTFTPGRRTQSLEYEITDETVETCASGEWKLLKRVGVGAKGVEGAPSVAVYEVSGSYLIMSLNSNWCDINDEIFGELKGETFEGVREAGGIFGSERVGKVFGERIRR
jgi:hypothetical protein